MVSKRLNFFPLIPEKKQRYQLPTFQFNGALEVLAKAIWQVKEIKDIQMRKEEIQLFICK